MLLDLDWQAIIDALSSIAWKPHGMAWLLDDGIIIWNRIPFLSRLPLRRSVHGLDMSDEHPARSPRFSLLTWRVKCITSSHAKHARTDSKWPVFNLTTALTSIIYCPHFTHDSCYVALHHAEYHIISHPFISTDCHLALSFQATAAGAAHGMHLQSSSRPTSGTNLQDVHGRFRCHPYDPIWCPTSPRLWQALISATSAGKLSQIIQYIHIISIYTS